ncbi:MAG: nuclease-related domain-containing protein [Chloroflexota bacterium]|nr:nuclease-related domain-containing protein [Chloroflexota bacterium]
MHNVVPSRALARRSRQLLALALLVGALGAFVIAIGILLLMIPLVAEGSTSFGVYNLFRTGLLLLGGLLFLVAIGLAVRAATWRTDNEEAQVVARTLAPQLDARYHFIRNLSRRDLGYIDAVLVGPPGVLTFRILDARGVFANEGADWLVQSRRGDWQPWRISPTRQVVEDIRKLRELLTTMNLGDVPVYGVIVFVRESPQVQLQGNAPLVPPTHLSSLYNNLLPNYLAKERIDARRIADTVRTLYQG